MVNVNDISSNSASLAAYNAAAAQRPPPQPRTETAPDTQRPVAPTQDAGKPSNEDRLSISRQAQSLAAASNENTESADQRRNDDAASQQDRGAAASATEQYGSVERMAGEP